MEMCYDGALVMPSNYAVMSEDEMTYVEGGGIGKHKFNKTSVVGVVIDAAIIVFSTGVSVYNISAIKKIFRKNGRKMVKRIEAAVMKHVGTAAAAMVSGAIDFAFTLAGASMGGLIAEALDRIDGHNDNYVFA